MVSVLSVLSLLSPSQMAAFQPATTLPLRIIGATPTFAFQGSLPLLALPHNPFKPNEPNSLFSTFTTNPNRPFSISTLPRKLLCRAPSGKYIGEDYLVKKKSAKEIEELVRGERNVPLIIDFYATWCGPCILMAQELEMLAVEYENNLMIVKVDTDDEYEFAHDMQCLRQKLSIS